MKKIKFLALLIMCSIPITSIEQPIYANNETTISPFYINISSTMTGLSNISGNASCSSTITAHSSSTNLKIFMYLERYVNGTWTPYASWSAEKTGSSLSLQKSKSVASGTYRVKTSYYANGENTVKYSATKSF